MHWTLLPGFSVPKPSSAYVGLAAMTPNSGLTQAPARQKHQTLKKFPLYTFSLLRWERAEKILTTTDLGDRKPSALVNHLLSTLREFGPEIILQQIFLKCLPSHNHDILASSDITDIENLGDQADQIMSRLHRQALSVCNVLPADDDSPDAASVQCISHRSSTLRTPACTQTSSMDHICYYHKRFGQAARQCKQPCSWTAGNAQPVPR